MRPPSPSQPRPASAADKPRSPAADGVRDWRVILSADVLERTADLSLVSLRLMMALEQYACLNPSCFPGNKTLAKRVGCSMRWVRRGLADLETAGWIRRVADPVRRDRHEIVLLRRLDPTKPVDGGGTIDPGGRNDRSAGGGHDRASVISTQSEERRSEEARRPYSAHADRCPRGRGRSTRSAGDGLSTGKRSKEPPRMNAREMDAAIREYSAEAGSTPPRCCEDEEPFG